VGWGNGTKVRGQLVSYHFSKQQWTAQLISRMEMLFLQEFYVVHILTFPITAVLPIITLQGYGYRTFKKVLEPLKKNIEADALGTDTRKAEKPSVAIVNIPRLSPRRHSTSLRLSDLCVRKI
jgi:hypothetical protein